MTRGLTRRDFLWQSGALGAALGSGLVSRQALADEVLKVGVVYVSPIAEIGWTKQHSLAVEAMTAAFPGRIEVTTLDNVFQPQDAERVFRDLAVAGNRLIFGTSFSHGTPLQKVARQFPDVVFEHCSGIKHLANLGTFEARYYEGTYVAGVAAGKMTKANKIGFIAGYPIPDVLSMINAATLGARRVNPEAESSAIFLNSWYDPGREKDAANTLVSQGCDVICAITDTATSVMVAEEKGVWGIGYASDMAAYAPTRQLTSFMLDWSSIYVESARDVMAGAWESVDRWEGLKAGVVKMAPYNKAIPADVVELLNATEAEIRDGALHPFAGEIRDQDGKVRVEEGGVLSDKEIRGFDWFVAGVRAQLS